ncbi:MAG: hypothetical protein ACR2GR_11730 [Rhodothermales bacterium]
MAEPDTVRSQHASARAVSLHARRNGRPRRAWYKTPAAVAWGVLIMLTLMLMFFLIRTLA